MNPEFKSIIKNLILGALEKSKKFDELPREARVWKCENTGDFLCGHFVGEITGIAIGSFPIFHDGREPTVKEHMEIKALLEDLHDEIKEFFEQYN